RVRLGVGQQRAMADDRRGLARRLGGQFDVFGLGLRGFLRGLVLVAVTLVSVLFERRGDHAGDAPVVVRRLGLDGLPQQRVDPKIPDDVGHGESSYRARGDRLSLLVATWG